ncbi:MAG: FAD-dependent oxidoreductase [Planctomycetales bacterium]|nr:FAD-dependent oxidoreductase [Planctomycetales bacterium]
MTMRRIRTATVSFIILLMLVPTFAQASEPVASDVVIYGATPAGIAAALAAADDQRSVLLIEPTGRIGGMTTHGLSHSDFHSFEAIHGPFLEFSQRVLKHYESTYGKDSEQVRDCWRGTHGEPSVNLLVFRQMLAEKPAIRILTQHRLTGVTVENQSIATLDLSRPGGETVNISPRLVIDASYEGDLLAAAGVPYRVGREARTEYNEPLAPETADTQVQGYNFRLCMTQDPKNRVPIPVPANYNRQDYAALVPLVKADKFRSAFGYPGSPFVLKAHLPALPNGKRDINDVSKGLIRLSLPGRNHDYPEGNLATRRRVEQEHLDWQLGLIHFVQTDPALPEAFRTEAATWGLCRDEFTDTNHIPPQIYVREARRMVGLRVYTEADTKYAPDDARARLHRDSIAIGEYSHNCHGTSHEGPKIGGRHTGEFYQGVAPYQIPYGVIVPKEMRNLLVPTACSASHVGFCAIRLEPIWMSLGGAAGHAAAMALEANASVQQVDVKALQKRIWAHGGATIHVSDVPPGHADFTAVQWWAGLGGLHGLEPAPAKPGARGKHIASQYYEAFPGHAAKLNLPLDDALKERWTSLANEHRLKVPAESTTRVDWIRKAFAASAEIRHE